MLAHFFSPRGMTQFSELFITETQLLLDRWHMLLRQGQAIDISPEFADALCPARD